MKLKRKRKDVQVDHYQVEIEDRITHQKNVALVTVTRIGERAEIDSVWKYPPTPGQVEAFGKVIPTFTEELTGERLEVEGEPERIKTREQGAASSRKWFGGGLG